MTTRSWLIAGAGLSLLSLLGVTSSGQSPESGSAVFEKRCGGCHALDRDKEGPRLGGVYGRMSGTVKSFQYSDALKNAKIVWDEKSLDKWLTDPEKLVPNNDMSFHLAKPEERRIVIEYLKTVPASAEMSRHAYSRPEANVTFDPQR